jgi:glutamine synthetase
MLFEAAELTRRAEEARPLVERLNAAGCRFAQVEAPDNNGNLRGKIVPLASIFSGSGTTVAKLMQSYKGGGCYGVTPPFAELGTGGGKMVLLPDLATSVPLPWKRDVAGVLCECYMNDGSPCPVDARHLLRSVENELGRMKYSARVALEYEVYIVEDDDLLMRQGRYAELSAFGRDRNSYSLSRSPPFEDLAKEFMSRCEAAGIHVEAFHTEAGCGMFEYTFAPQRALKAADDGVRAKLYLKQLCAERGLVASYMAAKSVGMGDACLGCHHNFSLVRGEENAFWERSSGGLTQLARNAATGVLETMPAFSIIYRPWVNSYRRMDHILGSPETASWGKDNHWVGIRVVHGAVPERMTRFEHRVSGADVNPYLSIASILLGALRGLREPREPPAYTKGDPTTEEQWSPLPRTLSEAVDLFRKSPAMIEGLGAEFAAHLADLKQEEWKDFAAAVPSPDQALRKGPVTDWEIARYFNHA